MSYTILLNSSDISEYVVSYTREKNICDGIGRIDLKVTKDLSSVGLWNILSVYEDNNLVGKFYVSSITKNEQGIYYSITGQDGSKKLSDYFLLSKITPKETTKTARELIQTILSEVGVSYSFSVSGNGAIIAPETEIGLQTAYDSLLSLVQQSGWYFYFDKNNICRIGKLKAGGARYTFTDYEILEYRHNYNDNSLRNKAIVWGGFDNVTGKDIFFSKRVRTPFDKHKKDIRSVVLSNGAIHYFSTAVRLANLLLSEFAKLNKEKFIKLAGFWNLEVGDVVKVNLKRQKFKGIITALVVSVSPSGIITECTIDKRCPRLFAWFEWGKNPDYNEYVYAGTEGGGVKRKPIGSSGWSDFSAGLQNLVIKDLRIYADNFICIADDGYAYIRTETTNWKRLITNDFYDRDGQVYPKEDVKAVSCAIDQTTGDYYVGYNYYIPETDYQTFRSWVVCFNQNGEVKYIQPVELYFTNRLLIHDLDRHSVHTFIGGVGDIADFVKIGYRDVYSVSHAETSLPFIFGPQLLTTSGGLVREKYEENNYLVPSGVYVYSGYFLEGNVSQLCSFKKELDWYNTHTLYDNGRIFCISLHDQVFLSIYDFTPSGITTLTGLPIKHRREVLEPIFREGCFGYNNRFLYLDKLPSHPELHALFLDTYRERRGLLKHFKITFDDYSYTTVSGQAELLYSDILVTPADFIYYVDVPLLLKQCNYEHEYFIQDLLADDGYLYALLGTQEGICSAFAWDNFKSKVFLFRYSLTTGEKTLNFIDGFLPDLDYSSVYIAKLSKFYTLPALERKKVFFFTNLFYMKKGTVQFTPCHYPTVSIEVIKSFQNVVKYHDFEIGKPYGISESFLGLTSSGTLEPVQILTDKTQPVLELESLGETSCKAETEPGGQIVGALGYHPIGWENRFIPRGYVINPSGLAVVDVFAQHTVNYFRRQTTIGNPWFCCGERDFIKWETVNNAKGVRLFVSLDEIIPFELPEEEVRGFYNTEEYATPLIVPSGLPPSFVSVQPKGGRESDAFITKIKPDELSGYTEEKISIPLFRDWGRVPIDHTCNYIDFFDNTVYFMIPKALYGIDYDTGILKKLITGVNYDIVFGEGWRNVPPTIHNGILFSRGAFWVFRTTVTGYFVFPILYQNPTSTNIVNIELLPTNVEVSKLIPYVTYNPFEYTLPNVSGSLVPFGGYGSTVKIYSVDFTKFLMTSKITNDVRVFDIFDDILLYSGIINLEDFRYIGIPENRFLYIRDVEFNQPFQILKQTTDLIYHIETSNLPEVPFVFLYQMNKFYEFDKEVWREFTPPVNKILTIRVDDLL